MPNKASNLDLRRRGVLAHYTIQNMDADSHRAPHSAILARLSFLPGAGSARAPASACWSRFGIGSVSWSHHLWIAAGRGSLCHVSSVAGVAALQLHKLSSCDRGLLRTEFLDQSTHGDLQPVQAFL